MLISLLYNNPKQNQAVQGQHGGPALQLSRSPGAFCLVLKRLLQDNWEAGQCEAGGEGLTWGMTATLKHERGRYGEERTAEMGDHRGQS